MILSGIGRLGADPKMQFNPQGSAITNFNVATKCGFGDKEETVWLSLVAYGKQAETLNQYLVKGNRLEFTAELQKVRTFDKKDGVGVSVDAKILTFTFIDSAKQTNEPEEF
jgi:single-strand DNA-binding protein